MRAFFRRDYRSIIAPVEGNEVREFIQHRDYIEVWSKQWIQCNKTLEEWPFGLKLLEYQVITK